MNCKSNTVKYGTEKYKICNGDAKNVNQRKNKTVFGYMAVRGVGPSFMSLSYDRRGAKKKFCEFGVANCLLKSWRKTSACEIRTFQYGIHVILLTKLC